MQTERNQLEGLKMESNGEMKTFEDARNDKQTV